MIEIYIYISGGAGVTFCICAFGSAVLGLGGTKWTPAFSGLQGQLLIRMHILGAVKHQGCGMSL